MTKPSDEKVEEAQNQNHFNLVSGSATLNMIVVGFVVWVMGFSLHISELLLLDNILWIGSIFIISYAPFSIWELSQVLCARSLKVNKKDMDIFLMSIQSQTRSNDNTPKPYAVNSTWSSLSESERKQFE